MRHNSDTLTRHPRRDKRPSGQRLNRHESWMSKRKLTRRQAWRIEKIQKERSQRATRKADQALEEPEISRLGPEREGLVIAHFGKLLVVEAGGERKRCHFRSNLGSLVTGDRVVWRDGEPYGVIEAVLPRRSELARPDPYGEMKTLAANIDRALIVIAPYPEPHFNLIDRYLVAAEASDITPALLINKCDAIDQRIAGKLERMEQLYRELGYEVLRLSVKTGAGINQLHDYLAHFTSVFVGQSGVGKSSLTNYLLPQARLRVGELSERQTGSHTTTNAQLFHLPGGGQLIDSPGVREFGLWHMSPEQVLENFVELRPFLGHCKFRDCAHQSEPGCALQQALADGHISEQRMNSCRQILASLSRP